MIEPNHGTIFDPACGSGGMFVHSAEFVRVSISDGIKRYMVTEFASLMAIKEVADTIEASAELRRKAMRES